MAFFETSCWKSIAEMCSSLGAKEESKSRVLYKKDLLGDGTGTQSFGPHKGHKDGTSTEPVANIQSLRHMIHRQATQGSTGGFQTFYDTSEFKKLGEGGFGEVYQARHIPTDCDRAVKLIKKSHEEFDQHRVVVELRSLLTLDHPHVCKLFEWFEDDFSVYIITELIIGKSLDKFTQDDNMQNLFRQLLEAVNYCHGQELCHRDLKMENILVVDRKVVKIIDFGIAAIKKPGDKDGKWMKTRIGTTLYMSPLMCNVEGGNYGRGCDIWACGIILYMLLTGEHPFLKASGEAKNRNLLFDRIRNSDYRREPLKRQGASEAEQKLVEVMLTKDASKRPTASTLIENEPWLARGSKDASPFRLWKHLATATGYTKNANSFDKIVLSFVARQGKVQDMDSLNKTFKEVDIDRDGMVSQANIEQAFSKLGMALSGEDAAAMFLAIDQNGDGRIEYTEWLAATLEPSIIASDLALSCLMAFFDPSGQGKIERKRLEQLCGLEPAADAMKNWDKKGTGSLGTEEVRAILENIAERRRDCVAEPPFHIDHE